MRRVFMSPKVVVLAAGEGKRMKSRLSKVLFPIAGRQALTWVIKTLHEAGVSDIIVVASSENAPGIQNLITSENWKTKIKVLYQKGPKGTGHSLLSAKSFWKKSSKPVLVINGDTPLIRPETLKEFFTSHQKSEAPCTLATISIKEPSGYGRIIRNHSGDVVDIVEEQDLSQQEKEVGEVNAGCYLFDAKFLGQFLPALKPSRGGEIYLTSIAKEFSKAQHPVHVIHFKQGEEFQGMNTRGEHADLCRIMQTRINNDWMERGVSILSPSTTWIDADVKIGEDVILSSNVHLVGKTEIAPQVTIEPFSIIKSSYIGKGSIIKAGSYIEESEVCEEAKIGPYAHLRPETVVGKGARVGNFVELKKTTLGPGSKANHLTYLGDATIGKETNIGAGVITCNYDGGLTYQGKAKTVVGNFSFVGSDVQLVAPVKVADHGYVASGTTLTKDVPSYSLAIARAKQENK